MALLNIIYLRFMNSKYKGSTYRIYFSLLFRKYLKNGRFYSNRSAAECIHIALKYDNETIKINKETQTN